MDWAESKLKNILSVGVSNPHVCLCTTNMGCQKRPEEGVRYPGTGVF